MQKAHTSQLLEALIHVDPGGTSSTQVAKYVFSTIFVCPPAMAVLGHHTCAPQLNP